MLNPPPRESIQQALLRAVPAFPNGGTREALQRAAGLGDEDIQKVRRALQVLAKAGRLRQEGHTRSRLYFPIGPLGEGGNSEIPLRALLPHESAGMETSDPLKNELLRPDGHDLRAHVRLPLMHRSPVGYRRAFLDAYRPNQTYYLDEALRNQLRALGSPDGTERPAGTYAREILQRLLIDLSWNSSRLEGNTYSLLDTERLIQQGQEAEGKDALEAQMILNHKAAIEFLVEGAETVGFEAPTLRNLHALLSENLLSDPADGGRVRQASVRIHGTTFLPLEVPQLLEECFLQILHTAEAIADPFEQAFFVLVQLPYLQPFIDMNKRTARLAANIPFIKGNLCPLSFVDVPVDLYTEGMLAVYELNRMELLRDVFVWAYARSAARYLALRESMGKPDPFRLRHRDALKEIVAHVVRHAADREAGQVVIHRYANELIPEPDRPRFLAVAEAELSALHEGNYARYRLRPAEFQAWRTRWGL